MNFTILTLGCKVNTYESNVMQDKLTNAGWIEDKTAPNFIIINTCMVTDTAFHKSLKMIKQAHHHHPMASIVVVGCVSQVKKEEVASLDGVDIVLGNVGKSHIVEEINAYLVNKSPMIKVGDLSKEPFEEMQLNNFNRTRAFIKIQDGCNNFCSYCIIPYTRGPVRSKPASQVLEEAKNLVKNGHMEIVLTGIHTGNYGAEFDHYDFADLLNDLIQIEGLQRIRISSIEITELNEKVLSVLENSPILVDHIHIPLQSGSDTVLKRMNRKYDKAYFCSKIEKIRQIRPNISLTTDVIVGFPGETEAEFLETVETIQKIGFSKLHVFPYSKREGTKAFMMENHISPEVKKNRSHILLELSKQLEYSYLKQFQGQTVLFLPEVEKDGILIGHTGNYLLIHCPGTKADLHQLIPVKIEKIAYPYGIGVKQNVFCKI